MPPIVDAAPVMDVTPVVDTDESNSSPIQKLISPWMSGKNKSLRMLCPLVSKNRLRWAELCRREGQRPKRVDTVWLIRAFIFICRANFS